MKCLSGLRINHQAARERGPGAVWDVDYVLHFRLFQSHGGLVALI